MESAIDETNRRRAKQVAYNTANGIDPQPLRKKIADITDMLAREDESTQALLETWQHRTPRPARPRCRAVQADRRGESGQPRHRRLPSADLAQLIQELTDQMKAAAELHFEVAARLRDEIGDLKKESCGMMSAGRSDGGPPGDPGDLRRRPGCALSRFWAEAIGYPLQEPPRRSRAGTRPRGVGCRRSVARRSRR